MPLSDRLWFSSNTSTKRPPLSVLGSTAKDCRRLEKLCRGSNDTPRKSYPIANTSGASTRSTVSSPQPSRCGKVQDAAGGSDRSVTIPVTLLRNCQPNGSRTLGRTSSVGAGRELGRSRENALKHLPAPRGHGEQFVPHMVPAVSS